MYQTIIIGAGQAGLAMGYFLKQINQTFVILDKNQNIGDEWRNRYDSLVLFTPRMYSALPGLPLEGDPHEFRAKEEIADYLKRYAKSFELPVWMENEVTRVWKENNRFYIKANDQEYEAENVIIASGPFQMSNIPDFSTRLSPDILQLHSSH